MNTNPPIMVNSAKNEYLMIAPVSMAEFKPAEKVSAIRLTNSGKATFSNAPVMVHMNDSNNFQRYFLR